MKPVAGRCIGCVLASFACFVLPFPAHAQYLLTDLGTLGGQSSYAYSINDTGEIVGSADTHGPNSVSAFLYTKGHMTNIGTPASFAYGISDSNEVTGIAFLAAPGYGHAARYSNGVLEDLGALGTDPYHTVSEAYHINNSGQIVGSSYLSGYIGTYRAFLYSNGVMTDLGTLGGASSIASSINDHSQIVGNAGISVPVGQLQHAFLFDSGVMTDLGTLGGNQSAAFDINNEEQIVGDAFTSGNKYDHAFLYDQGSMTDLGALPGDNVSVARAINEDGEIVGESKYNNSGVLGHAFLYKNGAMTELNRFLPSNSKWDLVYASDINDSGQIVGFGLIGNATHAFLLTPVPEPGTWGMLAGICASGAGFALRRRRCKRKA